MSTHDGTNSCSNKDTIAKFSTPQEEIAYLRSKLEETQIEFNEFQESSRELEAEYETQVKQLEKKNNDYLNQINKLEIENEHLRSKYTIFANDTQHKLNEYQQQIAESTALNNRLTDYIRKLEQNNDDLERARRALAASLEDFETQLNQQIERNVLLENEVSEKEELECVIQRLKEETRDLKHELIAKTNKKDPNDKVLLVGHNGCPSDVDSTTETTRSPPHYPTQDDNKTMTLAQLLGHRGSDSSNPSKDTDTKSQQTSPLSSPKSLPPAMVLSPTSRISALNLVSDLLRKVGVLESKLTSAKKMTNNLNCSELE